MADGDDANLKLKTVGGLSSKFKITAISLDFRCILTLTYF